MRPSWQIDLKWAAGLLACVAVLVAGVLFSLAQITGRDTAEPLATAIIAAGISDRVEGPEYDRIQAQAAVNPDAAISLSPLAVTVRGSEIAGLKKEDAAKLVAAKFAEVLYEKGSDEAKALIVTPPRDSDKTPLSLGPAGLLSSDKHSMFQTYFLISAIISVLLLAVVAGMSRGAGRLGAPAFVVVLSTAPLAALWALAAQAIGEGDSGDNPAILAARAAARSAASDLRATFVFVALIAFGLAVLALVGGIVYTLVRRIRRPRTASAPVRSPLPALATGKPQSLVERESA